MRFINLTGKILLPALIVSTFIIGGICFYTAESKQTEKENKTIPGDWFFRQRAFPTGKIDRQAYRKAVATLRDKQKSILKNEWTFAGPTNIGGRISDIEITAATIFIGAASGGIFKSTDFENWEPIFDNALSLSIGDMAIATSNNQVMYVGTGEANAGGGSQTYDGMGVYKTTDGGQNWNYKGLQNAGSIGKVLVNPYNADECYVAVMGYLFDNNQERGVYKTTDGGETWEQVLYVNDSAGFIDMAMHPHNPDTIYAAAWQRVRRTNYNNYGGASSGIYRTYDGGQNWEKLANGLPPTAGRIGIAIAESQPNILYTVITDEQTGYIKGIYKTTDNGDNWIEKSTDGIYDVPYYWWFGKIYVHPTDANTLYICALNMHKSTDGAESWTDVFSGVHVDQHAVAFDQTNPEKVFLGNDGGLYVSEDGGLSYSKKDGLPITQFYTCEIDYQNPERLYGGTQDNSSMRTLTGGTGDWEIISFGDGFYNLVDPVDNNFIYTESQYGYLIRSIDGGATWSNATNGIEYDARKNWNTPVVFNPTNSEELFYGAEKLYYSSDRAQSWTAISPDLTNGESSGNLVYNTITNISVSPIDDNIIVVGTDDGNVSITENGGDSWSNISGALPERWFTCVAAGKYDVETLFVTLSGYRFGENNGHVYKSENLGETWTNVTGDLPDVPVNKFIEINSRLWVVATDVGVFETRDNGATWEILGGNLPLMYITDLDYHRPTNKLVAASFGRGMFSIQPDTTSGSGIANSHENNSLNVYPNPTSGKVTVELPESSEGTFKVEIFDTNGKVVFSTKAASKNREKISLNVSGFKPGVYVVKLVNLQTFYNSTSQFVKH